MIVIAGSQAPIHLTGVSDAGKHIFRQKERSRTIYQYVSVDQLKFELDLRTQLVQASWALNASGVQFGKFEESYCNPQYWKLTRRGGFQKHRTVSSAAAVRDIYSHGLLYRFECATAMVIVAYRAVLAVIGDAAFNRLFPQMLIWDWHYEKELRLVIERIDGESYLGDILYFKNPDVHPREMEWQGENVVKMGDDLYYGHGVGVTTAFDLITELNNHRYPGSRRSAYMLNQATYPDFRQLYYVVNGRNELDKMRLNETAFRNSSEEMVSSVGSLTYIQSI